MLTRFFKSELFSCLPKGTVACAKVRAGDPIRPSIRERSTYQSRPRKKCGTGPEIIFLCPVGLACLVWLEKWTTDTWCCRFLYMKWFTIPWQVFNSLDEIPHLIITFEFLFLPDWRYQTTLLFERAGQVFWYKWCGRNKTTRLHKCNCTRFALFSENSV